jgi:hypothetical protein
MIPWGLPVVVFVGGIVYILILCMFHPEGVNLGQFFGSRSIAPIRPCKASVGSYMAACVCDSKYMVMLHSRSKLVM